MNLPEDVDRRHCEVCKQPIAYYPTTTRTGYAKSRYCVREDKKKSYCQNKAARVKRPGYDKKGKSRGVQKYGDRNDYLDAIGNDGPRCTTWEEEHPPMPEEEAARLRAAQRQIDDAAHRKMSQRADITGGPIFQRYMRGAVGF